VPSDDEHHVEHTHVEHWVLLPSPDVIASVLVAPVPEIPPAELRDLIVPRLDEGGHLDDWNLDVETLVDLGDRASTFWAWRSQWCRSWALGSQANLVELEHLSDALDVDCAPTLVDLLDRLVSLDDGEEALSVLQPSHVDELLAGLERLRGAIAASDGRAVALVDDTPGSTRQGLARSWPAAREERTLAADRSTSVLLLPDGALAVRTGGATPDVLVGVAEVDLRGEVVSVVGVGGVRLSLPPDQARPLAWLVPTSLRWHVRSVPVVSVWAGFFTGLPEAVRLAQRLGSTVTFRTHAPLGHHGE
jgi:hypothetical protein